jgi:hypothetical protein
VGAIPLGVLSVDPGGQRACRMLDQSTESGRSGPERRKEVEGDLKRLACSLNSLDGVPDQLDGLPEASSKR